MVEKLIVDGKVAVVYCPGFGSGWSTWCYGDDEEKQRLIFDRELASAVLSGDVAVVREVADRRFPLQYRGSNVDHLTVAWLPVGTVFRIEEYDGSESILTLDDLAYKA